MNTNATTEIATPTGSVRIWKDSHNGYCWATPNGSEGTGCKTYATAKREALEAQNPRQTYTVSNVYDIAGESSHRTPEAACRAAAKREGDGWIVTDQDGKRWAMNGPYAVCIG